MIARWLLYFLPAVLIELAAMLVTPVVALFVVREPREDRVKRMGNQVLTIDHDYLIKPLRWFQTVDNAVDEYWYGAFNTESLLPYLRNATQEQYDASPFLRYLCRCMWMWRNASSGFNYYPFGVVNEPALSVTEQGTKNSGAFWCRLTRRPRSWQLQAQIPLVSRLSSDINIGWKEYRGMGRLTYSARIIGLRWR